MNPANGGSRTVTPTLWLDSGCSAPRTAAAASRPPSATRFHVRADSGITDNLTIEAAAVQRRASRAGGRQAVAEVLVGLLQRDPNCYLYLDPSWKPAPPLAPVTGQFGFVDLLRYAGAAESNAQEPTAQLRSGHAGGRDVPMATARLVPPAPSRVLDRRRCQHGS